MKRVAVVGGGIAGLSLARMLQGHREVVVFEKEETIGGLLRCSRVNGHLFHLCGGHVFNSKNQSVLDWFWQVFDRDRDFTRAARNSAVCLEDGYMVPYPIENHVYMMDDAIRRRFNAELDSLESNPPPPPQDFDSFLRSSFGTTLYDLYFKPYNEKIWKCDLSTIPLSWLEGKLPMPTVAEMRQANATHEKETSFVHSSFWYPRMGGSQFLIDTLARGLDVRCNSPVYRIEVLPSAQVRVNGAMFDSVVYCGSIKELPRLLSGVDLGGLATQVDFFSAHGTTSVLCEVDDNPYSWVYQPSRRHDSHRIICTGNFSMSNNSGRRHSAVVEFTNAISRDDVERQLGMMPFHPRMLAENFTPVTYPIQHSETRRVVSEVRSRLQSRHVYLVGRFAEWEYFNMDAVVASVMSCVQEQILR